MATARVPMTQTAAVPGRCWPLRWSGAGPVPSSGYPPVPDLTTGRLVPDPRSRPTLAAARRSSFPASAPVPGHGLVPGPCWRWPDGAAAAVPPRPPRTSQRRRWPQSRRSRSGACALREAVPSARTGRPREAAQPGSAAGRPCGRRGPNERSASRTAALARPGSSPSETKTSMSPSAPLRTNALRPVGRGRWRTRIMPALLSVRPRPARPAARWPSTTRAGRRCRRQRRQLVIRPHRGGPACPTSAPRALPPRVRAAAVPTAPGRAARVPAARLAATRRLQPRSSQTAEAAVAAQPSRPCLQRSRSLAAGGGAVYATQTHLPPDAGDRFSRSVDPPQRKRKHIVVKLHGN